MTAPDAMTSRTRAFLARPCGGCAGLSADAMLAGYRNVGIARGSDRVDGLVELPGILGTDPGGVAPGCRGVVGLLDGLDRTRGGMFHRELSHPAEGSWGRRSRGSRHCGLARVTGLASEKSFDIDNVGSTRYDVATLASHHRLCDKKAVASSHPELVLATWLGGDAHLIVVGATGETRQRTLCHGRVDRPRRLTVCGAEVIGFPPQSPSDDCR